PRTPCRVKLASIASYGYAVFIVAELPGGRRRRRQAPLSRRACESLEDRAVGSFVSMTSLREIGQRGAHALQFPDPGVEHVDVRLRERLDLRAGALAVIP